MNKNQHPSSCVTSADDTNSQRSRGGVRPDNTVFQHGKSITAVQSVHRRTFIYRVFTKRRLLLIPHLCRRPQLSSLSRPPPMRAPAGRVFSRDRLQQSGCAVPPRLQPCCHSGRMNNQKCSTLFQKPRGRTRIIHCIYVVGFMVSSELRHDGGGFIADR